MIRAWLPLAERVHAAEEGGSCVHIRLERARAGHARRVGGASGRVGGDMRRKCVGWSSRHHIRCGTRCGTRCRTRIRRLLSCGGLLKGGAAFLLKGGASFLLTGGASFLVQPYPSVPYGRVRATGGERGGNLCPLAPVDAHTLFNLLVLLRAPLRVLVRLGALGGDEITCTSVGCGR